ncbi:hypothetical protein M8J77_009765 [Diaphorina citri]|nr:hypothetical protein M8J77_009765 [Diaphorina citri]
MPSSVSFYSPSGSNRYSWSTSTHGRPGRSPERLIIAAIDYLYYVDLTGAPVLASLSGLPVIADIVNDRPHSRHRGAKQNKKRVSIEKRKRKKKKRRRKKKKRRKKKPRVLIKFK